MAGSRYRASWVYIIELETKIHAALLDKSPDQFRFNSTSAGQLLDQMRDVCRFLVGHNRLQTRSNIPLDDFDCPAMTPGRPRPELLAHNTRFPLAVSSVAERRRLLAAACAVIDPDVSVGSALFGPSAHPAIDTFVTRVNPHSLERCMAASGRWSPAFVRHFADAQQRMRRSACRAYLETRESFVGTSRGAFQSVRATLDNQMQAPRLC